MHQCKVSIPQKCVKVAIPPVITGCYISTLDNHLLSITALCLTASSYQMILLYLPKEDSIA